MNRVMKRSGYTEEDFLKRDDLQIPNETFPATKIFRIQNNNENAVLMEILKIHDQLSS
jgi:dephospho-CoA kinase